MTNRQWDAREVKNDEFLAPAGRVLDSMLSEHQCEGWLEGYLLTGRHGLFNSYEAFIRIVDSMFSQHAKWLKVTLELPWRRKIASLELSARLPCLAAGSQRLHAPGSRLSSTTSSTKKPTSCASTCRPMPTASCRSSITACAVGITSMWWWPANTPAAMADHGRRGHPLHGRHRHLAMGQQRPGLRAGRGDGLLRRHPDAGDLGCRLHLARICPSLKIRVINVVDLMKLQPCANIRTGLSETDYDSLFTKDKHIIFGFHGYPWLVHRLTYRRTNRNLHVRGYKEEGTITTAFDMRVAERSRPLHLVQDVVDRVPQLGERRLPEADDAGQAHRAQTLHRSTRRGSAGDPQLEVGGHPMNPQPLMATAQALFAADKGLLAMDESSPTCDKRFAALGIPQTVEARRAYREMIVTTPGLGEYIGRRHPLRRDDPPADERGHALSESLAEAGIVAGIKVDTGAKALAGHLGEKITEGLDGLRDRLAEYARMGARFAKWRAVITMEDGIPSRGCIEANTHALARYAALCQEAGLVPVVEPEVLMDGAHTLQQCAAVTEAVLNALFEQLRTQGVMLEGTILKPNMALAGSDCPVQGTVEEIADMTVTCLLRTVPAAVPAIAFLSGGQSAELASGPPERHECAL